MKKQKLDKAALDQLFLEARTYNNWQNKAVEDSVLTELHDLCRMAPTSANCSPMRVIFVKSKESKEKLKPFLMEGNVAKTMSAPVCAILANDHEFYNHLPKLFPHTDAKAWFVGNQPLIDATAMRNGSLQGAYFIMAARSLGLDCGPMSGFDADGVNRAFFGNTPNIRANFLCNIGYGDDTGMHPRSPRFEFADICKII